jgi:hypothetical protein
VILNLRCLVAATIVAGCLLPAAAHAQTPSAATPPDPAGSAPTLKPRFSIGGTATTLRGDCQECEIHGAYLHTGGLLADVTFRVRPRMEAGVELFHVRTTTTSGDVVRATSVLAIAEYRPWATRGFFLKAGMGMSFVRNFYDPTGAPFTSKALGLTYGVGWTFRPNERAGLQVFGLQHVAALGDLVTSVSTFENVVVNLWSVGASVTIR